MKILSNNAFILVGIIALFIGCTKIDVVPTTNAKAIVEGYLIEGTPLSVRVKKEILYEGTNAADSLVENINDLFVTITDTINKITVIDTLDYAGNGYYADSSFLVKSGMKYSLFFTYNNSTVTGTTVVPDKPADFVESVTVIGLALINSNNIGTFPTYPDDISLTWSNASGEYYMVVVVNTETNPKLINTTNTTRPRPTFRNAPQTSAGYQIRPQFFQYFGLYNVVLFRINSEYALLYNTTGSSSQNLAAPPSNIQGNGLGIFTGINTDTLQLRVNQK